MSYEFFGCADMESKPQILRCSIVLLCFNLPFVLCTVILLTDELCENLIAFYNCLVYLHRLIFVYIIHAFVIRVHAI